MHIKHAVICDTNTNVRLNDVFAFQTHFIFDHVGAGFGEW